MNSTNVSKQGPKMTCGVESTIESTGRDFDSSYDDSFILRTKPMQVNSEESGFASENTFSFSEREAGPGFLATGIRNLGTKFDFKILGVKVNIK